MINAVIAETNDGYFAEFKGHARYAESGEDIVCAGVSALVCTVLSKLDEMETEGLIRYRGRHLSSGFVSFDFVPADNTFALDRAHTIISLLRLGISWLESEYPDCINLN